MKKLILIASTFLIVATIVISDVSINKDGIQVILMNNTGYWVEF